MNSLNDQSINQSATTYWTNAKCASATAQQQQQQQRQQEDFTSGRISTGSGMLTITLKVGQGVKAAPKESTSCTPLTAIRELKANENGDSNNNQQDQQEQQQQQEAQPQQQQQQQQNETAATGKAIVGGEFRASVVWQNVLVFVLLHTAMLYGMYVALFHAMWKTWLFALVVGQLAGLGVTAGAHRLWSHRSYRARLPLRIVLMLFNCLACQNDLYEWTRDHRVHHKFSETDADPHNVNRGFFFAHVGWLMCKKHPEVFRKGKSVDCSDLLQDPVIRFQRKFYVPLTTFICFYLPTVLPYYLFGETYWNAFFVSTMTRYVFSLNFTWLVNSAAHLWGNKPYDRHISPAENRFVSMVAIGEGFHNYHHTFPWDYRTSELGWKLNITSVFIEAMAAIGQAYDLKTVPTAIVQKRMQRTGDGTKDCFDDPANRTRTGGRRSEESHHEEVSYEDVHGHQD